MKSWVCTDWHRISISVPHSIVSKSFDKKHRQGKKDNDMGDDNELRQGWQHSSKIICGCSLEAIKNVKLLNSKSRFISPFSFFCVFLFFPSFFFKNPHIFEEFLQLCTKFHKFSMKISRETICQSWLLWGLFFNKCIVHWSLRWWHWHMPFWFWSIMSK